MAAPFEDGDYFEDEYEDSQAADKPRRKSTKGRTLMRWDVEKDQFLLLMVDYVCARDGVALPWEAIGAMLTPKLTPEAIKQHLAKVYKHRVSEGYEVPPPLDKSMRKRAKPATRVASPSVNQNIEEEGPKRSSLLPPRKPARRGAKEGNGNTQRGKRSATKKAPAVAIDDSISPVSSIHSFDQSGSYGLSTRYQSEMPAPTFWPSMPAPMVEHDSHAATPGYDFSNLTADQCQMLELNIAAGSQLTQYSTTGHTDEPRLSGIRNDVFLGVGDPAGGLPLLFQESHFSSADAPYTTAGAGLHQGMLSAPVMQSSTMFTPIQQSAAVHDSDFDSHIKREPEDDEIRPAKRMRKDSAHTSLASRGFAAPDTHLAVAGIESSTGNGWDNFDHLAVHQSSSSSAPMASMPAYDYGFDGLGIDSRPGYPEVIDLMTPAPVLPLSADNLDTMQQHSFEHGASAFSADPAFEWLSGVKDNDAAYTSVGQDTWLAPIAKADIDAQGFEFGESSQISISPSDAADQHVLTGISDPPAIEETNLRGSALLPSGFDYDFAAGLHEVFDADPFVTSRSSGPDGSFMNTLY